MVVKLVALESYLKKLQISLKYDFPNSNFYNSKISPHYQVFKNLAEFGSNPIPTRTRFSLEVYSNGLPDMNLLKILL
jgi:hypothetical protein